MNHLIEIKRDKIPVVAAILGIVFILLIIAGIYTRNQHIKIDDIKQPVVKKTSPFDSLRLSAKAAVVWDVKNRTFLFHENAESILPLASLTKLMTVLAATEILPQQFNVPIRKEYLEEPRDEKLGLRHQWNIGDLISFTLTTSSNGGAKAIASAASAFLPEKQGSDPTDSFVEYINTRGKTLGLSSTHFLNDSGLDVSDDQGGAYGSARDVAILMDFILKNHPELLESTKHAKDKIVSDRNALVDIQNTNPTVESIPGVLGSKTGFTDLAQGNLAVAFAPGLEGPYIAVILGADYDKRFTDMDQLIQATLGMTSE